MNVLALFDGISCGQVALQRVGFNVDEYFASEIDKSAISITQKNYPSTKQLGDINNIDEDFLLTIPKIDLILAGSPCQSFSRQGAGLNFDDPRGQLFFKFVKILNWLKENNNPDVKFILENVIMKKEWEDVITEFVGVSPIKIDSHLLSAQKRQRLYWTNIEDVVQPEDLNTELKSILEDDVDESYTIKEDELASQPITIKDQYVERFITQDGDNLIVRNATKLGYLIAEDGDCVNMSIPNSLTRRGRVGKKKTNTLDTQCNQAVYTNGTLRRFTPVELERLQTLPDNYTEGIPENKRKYAIGNGWTVDVIAHILSFMK